MLRNSACVSKKGDKMKQGGLVRMKFTNAWISNPKTGTVLKNAVNQCRLTVYSGSPPSGSTLPPPGASSDAVPGESTTPHSDFVPGDSTAPSLLGPGNSEPLLLLFFPVTPLLLLLLPVMVTQSLLLLLLVAPLQLPFLAASHSRKLSPR